ncbi:MAG: hypothetical protein DMD82_12985 [Candidatus Rokuibacteriota bacterium]|nr:MAG: hypothetical protein DMD82_12985 [Candidatus Rokubacteria bacterium]
MMTRQPVASITRRRLSMPWSMTAVPTCFSRYDGGPERYRRCGRSRIRYAVATRESGPCTSDANTNRKRSAGSIRVIATT